MTIASPTITDLQSMGVAGTWSTCRNPFEHGAADRITVPRWGRFELAREQRERK
jgi:hypothetical protein